ncbi:MAG: hypothetical protein K1X75_15170 [Leptospirales bacterium]|nr:hypothetical protein [Leptospirales bacterium]
MPAAVIDNDVLAAFADIQEATGHDLLALSRALLQHIHVPVQVKAEYERQRHRSPVRARLLDSLTPNGTRISICTSYDSAVVADLELVIDPGEAGAISQAQKLNVPLFLSNDRRARITAVQYGISVLSGFSLLAGLHLAGEIIDAGILVEYDKKVPVRLDTVPRLYAETNTTLGLTLDGARVARLASQTVHAIRDRRGAK